MSTSNEKTSGQPSRGAVGWKTVSVFVSSTFDDMHAERDYLVKEVFPRLREWCEQRRLRLVDVDLRWGVTEADATNNKRVVDVCLRRIDDCRPFFICLLGQRYGWIPRRQDVAPETSGAYPHIAGALGAASVTEMEIQHSTVAGKHVSDAFFYLRDPSYLADLPSDPAQLRQRIYTDEAEEDAALRKEKLRVLREQKIPATGRPVRQYSARWNPGLRTPEIALPPQCPATLPENIETWRKNWQRWAEARVVGTDVDEDAAEGAKAAAHNAKLTHGRLSDFAVGERSLGDVIFEDLQQAIALRFPDDVEAGEQTDLQRELDLQEELIATAVDGFIGRDADLAALDGYADSDDARLFAVAAAGGIGKTTLLAKWIANRRDRGDVVFCRFIGVGDRSSSVDSLLDSLLDELREAGRIESEIPTDPKKLREKLAELLAECGKRGRAIIVIDALNQLDSGLGDLDWLPKTIPAGIKIVVSFKTGTPAADDLLARWRAGARPFQAGGGKNSSAPLPDGERPPTSASAGEGPGAMVGLADVRVHECRGFDNIADRKALVTGYLQRHLKELDQTHLEALVTVPGAENPLYLRVVLGELRVFGAFGQLRDKLAHDFGTTPVEAFAGVLRRLETDPAHAVVPPTTSVPLIFGLLAHAHGGLPEAAIVDLVRAEVKLEASRRRDVAASVALVLRQLRPYLAHREGRIDFFFESFQNAAKQRYTRPDTELPVRSESAWSDAMANWCATWERLEGTSQRYALRWLPTHLMDAGRGADAVEVMTEFGYHYARLEKLGANDVLEVTRDFAMLAKAKVPADRREAVETWQRFHDENAHFLRRPGIRPEVELMQKAYAHADTSPVTRGAEAWLEQHDPKTWWFRKLGRPKEDVRSACLRVIEGPDAVLAVVIHGDGRRVVSAAHDGLLRVWDIRTGECLHTLAGHTGGVRTVAIHGDGLRVISGSDDSTLKVWDINTGYCLRTIAGHSSGVAGLALHPDGRRVLLLSSDGILELWDLEAADCLLTVSGHRPQSTSVLLHPDGRRAFSAGWDGLIKVWDIDTGECLRVLRHTTEVRALGLHPDNRRILSAGGSRGDANATIRVWDIDTGQCLRTIEEDGNTVYTLALHPDWKRVFAAGIAGTIEAWDVDTGARTDVLDGHGGTVLAVALSADGRLCYSAGIDKTLRAWDLRASQVGRVVERHTGGVESVALHADAHRALSGGADGVLRFWDVEEGKALHSIRGHRNSIAALAFHADGHRAISASGDSDGVDATVALWDVDAGKRLGTLRGHTAAIADVALHADRRRVVSASDDSTVRVWDLDMGTCLKTLAGHTGGVNSVALHADRRRVVSASDDSTVRVWDLDGGACLRTLAAQTESVSTAVLRAESVRTVVLHPDGRRAVSGSQDGSVRVWDLDSGVCLRTLVAQTGPIRTVILHPDGRRAMTCEGYYDSTILRLWDLDTGACLMALAGHAVPVNVVALHVDGRRAVTGSTDGTLRMWDLETGACLSMWLGGSTFQKLDLGLPLANGRTRIVAGCNDGSVHFFELMPPGPLTRTTLVTWSPARPLIASVHDTGAITLHHWHGSSSHLEELARSVPTSAPITSLRFSLDGTRLQVLTADGARHILDAFTGDRQVAPTGPALPPTCDWAAPRDTSPDGAWRAVIRDGRLVVEPTKAPS
jgi:WD40 repeat protein